MATQPNASALKGLTYATAESECARIEAQPVFHQGTYVFPY